MFTEPEIVTSDDLSYRSYITFYFDGERVRIYNGKRLGKNISPNRAHDLPTKNRLLKRLEYITKKALEAGWSPDDIKKTTEQKPKAPKTLKQTLDRVLEQKKLGNYSQDYIRDLTTIHRDFISFLTQAELNDQASNIPPSRIEEFLKDFNSSGTYFMNKRRNLGVFLNAISSDLMKGIGKRKATAELHLPYSQKQLKELLEYTKSKSSRLHLCCLLTYGCLLRPHKEIRQLKLRHFSEDFSEIRISGYDNKSRSVRVVFVPEYVKTELKSYVTTTDNDHYIMTNSSWLLNEHYFSTLWSRVMKKYGKLEKNQTIYSLRHTAALKIYNKTKDPYILQRLLGHSDLTTTLKYLRSLGVVIDSQHLINALPEL